MKRIALFPGSPLENQQKFFAVFSVCFSRKWCSGQTEGRTELCIGEHM